MKRCIIYMIVGYSQFLLGQLPAIDPLSGAGSTALIFEYKSLAGKEEEIKEHTQTFRDNFSKRALSKFDLNQLTLRASFSQKIKNKLIEIIVRADHLITENNKLSVFSYSRKNDNKKLLNTTKASLINMSEKFTKKLKTFGVYGEKMNAYQNFMRSLTKVNRDLDIIEGKISKGNLLEKILTK